MSKFEPGQKKPEGSGRKKGTPNKKSQHLSDVLEAQNIDIAQKLMDLLPELPKTKQADILVNLMNFLFPKKKSVEVIEHKDPEDSNMTVTYVDPEPCEKCNHKKDWNADARKKRALPSNV